MKANILIIIISLMLALFFLPKEKLETKVVIPNKPVIQDNSKIGNPSPIGSTQNSTIQCQNGICQKVPVQSFKVKRKGLFGRWK